MGHSGREGGREGRGEKVNVESFYIKSVTDVSSHLVSVSYLKRVNDLVAVAYFTYEAFLRAQL